MDSQLTLVVVVIAVALTFDFLNGFHDAANSIATVVSTRVLSPRTAVLLAAPLAYVKDQLGHDQVTQSCHGTV